MPASDLLDIGDKVASIIGALAAIAALLVNLSPRAPDRHPHPYGRRLRLGAALLAAASACAIVAARAAGWLAPGASWPVLALSVAAALLVLADLTFWGRSPLVTGDLATLLRAQHLWSAEHPYRFLGMRHAPSLSAIYVEQLARQAGDGRYRVERVITVTKALGLHRHVLLVAGPGEGKSTFVRQAVAACARWWLPARQRSDPRRAPLGPVVPIAVPAHLLDDDLDLAAVLAAAAKTVLGLELPTGLFAAAPMPGARWLVMVDALDEVSDQERRSRILWRLGRLLAEPGEPYRVLVCTRPLRSAELAELRDEQAGEYRLRGFGPAELELFARRWFTARHRGQAGADVGPRVRRFRALVGASRLTALARVPLLATLAAFVVDADDTADLPLSRTGLYELFLRHLRHGRGPADETMEPHADELLEALALAQLGGDDPDLLGEAMRRAPADRRPEQVRQWLTRTGLLTIDGDRLRFAHQSFAEYLAAGPKARVFDEKGWLADMANPATRSLAMFTLGRSGRPAEPLVLRLLGDPVAAGEMLIDGFEVGPQTRRQVIEALAGDLAAQSVSAGSSLRLLTELIEEPRVRTTLAELALDTSGEGWARVAAAITLADHDPADAGLVLRTLVCRGDLSQHGAGAWALQDLAARGDPFGRMVTLARRYELNFDLLGNSRPQYRSDFGPGKDPVSQTMLRRHVNAPGLRRKLHYDIVLALAAGGEETGARALRAMIDDRALSPRTRVRAARDALRLGDEEAAARLRAILPELRPALRYQALDGLRHAGHEVAGELRALARETHGQHDIRAQALSDLYTLGHGEVYPELVALLTRRGVRQTREKLARQVMRDERCDQRALAAIVVSVSDRHTRLDAVDRLTDVALLRKIAAEDGEADVRWAAAGRLPEHERLASLRAIALDPAVKNHRQRAWAAVCELDAAAGRELGRTLLRDGSYMDEDGLTVAIALADEQEAQAWISRALAGENGFAVAYRLARGGAVAGVETLWRWAHSAGHPDRVRAIGLLLDEGHEVSDELLMAAVGDPEQENAARGQLAEKVLKADRPALRAALAELAQDRSAAAATRGGLLWLASYRPGLLGEEVLRTMVTDDELPARERIWAMDKMPEPSVELLRRMSEDADVEHGARLQACLRLMAAGENTDRLRRLIAEPGVPAAVRLSGARALLPLDEDAGADLLESLTGDPELGDYERLQVLREVERIRPGAAAGLARLIFADRSVHPYHRYQAATLLCAHVPAEGLAAQDELMMDRTIEHRVRRLAALTLLKAADERGLRGLVAVTLGMASPRWTRGVVERYHLRRVRGWSLHITALFNGGLKE
ncbi:hypothetical protein [Streptosporangium sp. NPDC002524]|uniref:hypothetical protein n=1 Tax=Streptosporangium sp. NPDC002524 TaxID=3154537 RepID=UPI0033303163